MSKILMYSNCNFYESETYDEYNKRIIDVHLHLNGMYIHTTFDMVFGYIVVKSFALARRIVSIK